MCAWSLTYLETDISQEKLFTEVSSAFQSELNGKVDGWDNWTNYTLKPIKLEHTFARQFENREEAEIAGHLFFYSYSNPGSNKRLVRHGQQQFVWLRDFKIASEGLMVYPRDRDFYTIADTIMGDMYIFDSGRLKRSEAAYRQSENPQFGEMVVFPYMHFLERLTRQLGCQAANVMYSGQPSGGGTSVHFYNAGEMIDSYCFIEETEIGFQHIELLQHEEDVRGMLGGRFDFLTQQPKMYQVADDEEFAVYFRGGDLIYDQHSLYGLDIDVPFVMDDMLPYAAICCASQEIPPDFLQQFQVIDG